ncbi:MAG: hypothetical protein ABIJ91_04265 [Candidatus Kuenenbacteria bacterium]
MPVNPEQIKSQISPNSDIKKMLEEQKKLLDEIYAQSKKTKRYIAVGRIISLIYLILIVAPIIFAVIYLPPIIKQFFDPYKQLLNVQQGSASNPDTDTINNLLKQFGR